MDLLGRGDNLRLVLLASDTLSPVGPRIHEVCGCLTRVLNYVGVWNIIWHSSAASGLLVVQLCNNQVNRVPKTWRFSKES